MNAVRLAVLSLACLVPLAAAAEWQWLDNAGRRVFSDQPPPPDIAPNRILKQPGMRSAAVPAESAPAPVAAKTAPGGVDPTLKPAGKDQALEEKRKQAAAAEAEKKKAEEQKVAAARADNCTRARGAKANLESGQRIVFFNDKGEREFMDDARRAAEIRRAEEIIASDCRADRQ
ncbi:MAG TPA: DUF4124 domain-containing protein [Ramlibacter sp.]|uniref:DUF4124 domain-containing protein n=1 Tax=Ramlibacter sp. TaxID=1917967 RepID=UPI002D7F6F0B|nr:DUF4124 domain-containing protein [Ramlibacter sp.]HET8747907.1 DUF4124 domain-containing protein [Ramlibacter sp.]